MTAITVQATRPELHAPRGSVWAATLATALWEFAAGCTKRLAHRPRSRAEEAAAVRELAHSVERTDPGFASDLYAAAARYESEES